MAKKISFIDRTRIERMVWSLDQQLYDLPRRTRVAHRRELRGNLIAAAQDMGTSAALRDLGDASALADEYLKAELGAGPRPSWYGAGLFLATATFLLNSILFDAAQAFGDGILVGNPDADGIFSWSGIWPLQNSVTYTVANGEHTFLGGSFSLFTWALLVCGAICFGKLWRALPSRRPLQEKV